MIETPEAYHGDPPFVADSDTSVGAAYRMKPGAAIIRADVLRFFVARGERGATDEETQVSMKLGANTQRPRRRELELGGYVVRTDARRQNESGYWAGVYEVTSAGLTWAALNAPGEALES